MDGAVGVHSLVGYLRDVLCNPHRLLDGALADLYGRLPGSPILHCLRLAWVEQRLCPHIGPCLYLRQNRMNAHRRPLCLNEVIAVGHFLALVGNG